MGPSRRLEYIPIPKTPYERTATGDTRHVPARNDLKRYERTTTRATPARARHRSPCRLRCCVSDLFYLSVPSSASGYLHSYSIIAERPVACMFVHAITRGSAGFARRGLLAAALALRLRFPRPTIQTQLNTLQRFGLPPPPRGALGPRRLGAVYIHQSRCPLHTASASRRVAVAAARWAALFDSPPRLLRPHRALRLAAFTCDT